MPYTKRKAHHIKIDDLIEYITNEEKTDGGLLVTGHNCHANFAKTEFNNTQNKYDIKNRVGYHLIQSFAPDDDITPEQAHEIGVRIVKELYPNFQAVIATHIDKGHIHNHIALNSVSLDGHKLIDKRNHKEGLYAYQKKSDEISAEYGCYIMPETNLDYAKNIKEKDLYYSYKHQTWKQQIVDDMRKLQFQCKSFDEFIMKLFDLGYDIKYGKYIAVKPQGKERYTRLKSLGEEFSEEKLREYFNGKDVDYYYNFKSYTETEFNAKYLEYYRELQIALKLTSSVAIKGGKLPQFTRTKRRAEVHAEKVQRVLDLLNKANIQSYDDLENYINVCRNNIKKKRIEIIKYERENKDIIETIDKCQTFLMLYREYKYAQYYKSVDTEYVMPPEMKLYEDLSAELGINTMEEATELLSSARKIRVELNQLKSDVYDLEQELYTYDVIKEEQLLKAGLFIHNIKLGNNRIDFENCTDKQFCFSLPYCDYFVMIDKSLTTFNHKYGYNTLFLIDDKSYQLYTKNENGKLQPIEKVSGEQMERFVSELKDANIQLHKEDKKEKN